MVLRFPGTRSVFRRQGVKTQMGCATPMHSRVVRHFAVGACRPWAIWTIDPGALPFKNRTIASRVEHRRRTIMNDNPNRQCVVKFFDAYYSGDVETATACCDEAFETVTYAPVDLFPHLGVKQG